MGETDFGSQWRNIDAPGDTAYFVRFMDVINSIPWFKYHKRQAIDMMEIQAGDRVLEVGCGTGEEARLMGQLAGGRGQVTAVDVSQTMVDEARRRTDGTNLPVEYRVSDAHRLDFPDASFEATGSFNVFEIVQDPRQALAEMVRVTKPSGRVVVPGPDTGTMAINSPERELTRRMMNHFCDNVVNGWIGRRLPGMFKEFGLTDLKIVPNTLIMLDYRLVRELWLQSIADNARDAGAVTPAEAQGWLESLEQVSQSEGFFFSTTAYLISGRKP